MGIENFPIEKQIAAVKREIRYRKQVYPRLIADGRMSKEVADHQLGAMSAVLATLERVAHSEGPQQPLI